MSFDLKKIKKAYFVGIKGVGMTALALYLNDLGIEVLGSDVSEEFQTDSLLSARNIPMLKGFNPANLPPKLDLVVVTGAHGGATNVEAKEAVNRGILTFMHGQALGEVMKNYIGISIAGSHGKTTTAAIIATILSHSHTSPSYVIGAAGITPLGSPGRSGAGRYFIAEADEYATCPLTIPTPRFLWQRPKVLVITNIEFDHPDVYKDEEALIEAFLKFTSKVSKDGLIVLGIDNQNVQKLSAQLDRDRYVTYGFSPLSDYRIQTISQINGSIIFTVVYRNLTIAKFTLSIPGAHNVLNATAAFIVSQFLGINHANIRDALPTYKGTKRRFEKIAQIGDTQLFDDYAHHPTEIHATIKAAKEWFPGRKIVVIFQPHTYSRTKALFRDFVRVFLSLPATVILTDIFPSAREKIDQTTSSKKIYEEVIPYKKDIFYLPKLELIQKFLHKNIKEGDVIFTMGAGDIYSWHKAIERVLRERFKIQ
ncbi:UDP-N-acetylmuramate--L-alanine ligase [Candidatus Gottesmanbacteria bacterium]|nr:UDP-N-acetylmuramate--L-alanine ligase [Candidatus Gottesmanbacteria bacterium]